MPKHQQAAQGLTWCENVFKSEFGAGATAGIVRWFSERKKESVEVAVSKVDYHHMRTVFHKSGFGQTDKAND